MSAALALVRSVLLVVVFATLAPPGARAQAPGSEAPLPVAVDLAKVPLGSWADYQMSVGAMAPMTTRMALVARAAGTHTVEMSVEGGMMAAAGGKMVIQTILDGDSTAPSVKTLVMQLGSGDPMVMPPDAAKHSQFRKLDPKTLVGSETVKVAAGSFKTKHYRNKTPQGDKLDYWISETAFPLGLVRMEAEQTSNPAAPRNVKVELRALGKDAKPAITKPPKPFDEGALRQQMMKAANAGGQPGPGAPPPAAPAPAAPAKK